MNESVNESVTESMNESVNESNNVSKNKNESIDKIDDNGDRNNYFNFNIIDKTKSFEDQIEILKKWIIWVNIGIWIIVIIIRSLNFAHILNDVDEQLLKKYLAIYR